MKIEVPAKYKLERKTIRLKKGEFFTKRDVVCLSCGANPLEACRVFNCGCKHKGKELTGVHGPRLRAFHKWGEFLIREKYVEIIEPVPDGFPWFAAWWIDDGRVGFQYPSRYGILKVVREFK